MNALNAGRALRKLARPAKARVLRGFFKTGKGDYGEGDEFLGVSVPDTRSVALRFLALNSEELEKLLSSKFHEERLLALLVLVEKFNKGSEAERGKVFDFYIENLHAVNNWDLVDLTADKIVGPWLERGNKGLIYEFAESEDLWRRRIAMVSTFHYIKQGEFGDAVKVAELLLGDGHDLVHKAVGWMLREIGKRDAKTLEAFLRKNKAEMSRTTLRYAIERMPERKRNAFLR